MTKNSCHLHFKHWCHRNRPLARWCPVATTTRILQGFAFLCKLGLLYLNLTGITKFKYERKNEMNSGQSSKKLSLCKWPVGCYLQVGLKVLISLLYIPALAAPLKICWINGDFKVLRSLWRILMLIKGMLVVQVYLIYTPYICWK